MKNLYDRMDSSFAPFSNCSDILLSTTNPFVKMAHVKIPENFYGVLSVDLNWTITFWEGQFQRTLLPLFEMVKI